MTRTRRPSAGGCPRLDTPSPHAHTESIMQLSFRSARSETRDSASADGRRLADLKRGEQGILAHIDLPEDMARRLMELGFLPGSCITAARSAPGGDPRVFQVDGSEVALRRETAVSLLLQ